MTGRGLAGASMLADVFDRIADRRSRRELAESAESATNNRLKRQMMYEDRVREENRAYEGELLKQQQLAGIAGYNQALEYLNTPQAMVPMSTVPPSMSSVIETPGAGFETPRAAGGPSTMPVNPNRFQNFTSGVGQSPTMPAPAPLPLPAVGNEAFRMNLKGNAPALPLAAPGGQNQNRFAPLPMRASSAAALDYLGQPLQQAIGNRLSGQEELEAAGIAGSNFSYQNMERWATSYAEDPAVLSDIITYADTLNLSDRGRAAFISNAAAAANVEQGAGRMTQFEADQQAFQEEQFGDTTQMYRLTENQNKMRDLLMSGQAPADIDTTLGLTAGTTSEWIKTLLSNQRLLNPPTARRSSSSSSAGSYTSDRWMAAGDARRGIMYSLGEITDPSGTLTESQIKEAGWNAYMSLVETVKSGGNLDTTGLTEEQINQIMSDATAGG